MPLRRRSLTRFQQALISAQEIGDEKLQIVQHIQDLIENKTRQLDVDFGNLGTTFYQFLNSFFKLLQFQHCHTNFYFRFRQRTRQRRRFKGLKLERKSSRFEQFEQFGHQTDKTRKTNKDGNSGRISSCHGHDYGIRIAVQHCRQQHERQPEEKRRCHSRQKEEEKSKTRKPSEPAQRGYPTSSRGRPGNRS